MPSPSDRSEPLTRDRIVWAAREQLATDGLDKLSLRRLASTLGVTAPALYAYVTDKQDLLAGVAETGFAELLERFDALGDSDPATQLHEMARVYVGFALEHPELFRVMFRFRPSSLDVPDTDNTLDAATETFARSGKIVAAAQAAGVIHPDRDAGLAALVLWTASHGSASVLLLGVVDGNRREIPDFAGLVDEMVDVTLAGLSTPPK